MATQVRDAFRGYAALLLLSICVYALMYAPQPMFNTLSRDFGVDRATTGLTLGVYMLSLSMAPLCVGLLLGRIGIRWAIVGSVALVALSGPAFLFVETFPQFLAVRVLQGLLAPVLLTAVMTSISHFFRHLDMGRAMAGYITSNLVGSMAGRLLGGYSAELFGWRMTLTVTCLLFLIALLAVRAIPDKQHNHRVHRPAEYLLVLRQKGVLPLVFVEACGIFVFAAIGNLIPFRMAELGQGQSEGLAGLMYLGYSVGLIVSLALGPLTRLFGNTRRLLLCASGFFMLSMTTMAVPSLWMLFGGLWLVAAGEFIVHAMCPGLINRFATQNGQCDRGMVNGLFLSCYYMGGVLGSFIPALLYSLGGWLACYACMQLVLVAAFLVLVVQRKLYDY